MACSSQDKQPLVTLLLLIPLPAPPYSLRYPCADHGVVSNVSSHGPGLSRICQSLSLACGVKASASRAGGAQAQTP